MKGNNSLPATLRKKEILSEIENNQIVNVNKLSTKLGVAKMTIRRDLALLEKEGKLERIHGGAIANSSMVEEPLFSEKNLTHIKEKKAIAKKAASIIKDNDVILINSGSTTLKVFSEISANNVTCITNNSRFSIVKLPQNLQVFSTGGLFRKESNTYIGEDVQRYLLSVKANLAILGIDGFSIEYGLTTPVREEATINATMIECASNGKVIIVCDSSKLDYCSNFKVADIDTVDILITDKGITTLQRKEYENLGINVIIAD